MDSEVLGEASYIRMIRSILSKGDLQQTRNGNTYSLFGAQMRFSLENDRIPLLTTKKVAWKTCLKELLWFISGSTDNETLQKQNVHIWDRNADRAFLDSQGFYTRAQNDLGPIYGHQWRHYNASYEDCKTNYTGKGVDQLQEVIDALKDPDKRSSRRIIMSAWNPIQTKEMALPPCHVVSQFYVNSDRELSCALYQRSGDMGLGVPFNIASYSFLTHLLAKHCGLVAKEFVHFIGNAHVYEEHIAALTEQITREIHEPPKIQVLGNHDAIEDYTVDDFKIEAYTHHGPLSMLMKP